MQLAIIFFIIFDGEEMLLIIFTRRALLVFLVVILFVIHLIVLLLDVLQACQWLHALAIEAECFHFACLVVAFRTRRAITGPEEVCVLAARSLRPPIVNSQTVCLSIEQFIDCRLVRSLRRQQSARAR